MHRGTLFRMKNNSVRLGVIGLGIMGAGHIRGIMEGRGGRHTIAAVCDADPERFAAVKVPDGTRTFTKPEDLMSSGVVDAVLIVTPHFSHPDLSIMALNAGLHVLVEKPVAVQKADAQRMMAAHTDSTKIFAAMFNQRTDPKYQKLRALIQDGQLGKIQRINWIITDWFRSDAYYASGSWRATWAGEGGGVLLNQCPHQLDLWQWLFGMPQSVQAFCNLGQYHDIEVEDDVTAFMTYADGATGVFITTTGEAPGTNRLEIAADQGKVIVEDGKITFYKNETATSVFSKTTKELFGRPEAWTIHIPVNGSGPQHMGVLTNFADAILDGAALLAPAAEGIHSVELANAMLLSAETQKPITLPMDAAAYKNLLDKRMVASRYHQKK